MGLAQDAAPEIDRLVISVNRRVGPKHGARLTGLARDCGLETLELLPHFEDFLLAGTLTRELATLRLRYWPEERVLGRLGELEKKQLIQEGDAGLAATSNLRPLLEALLSARADIAADAWGEHAEEVATASHLAAVVADAASDEHVVAVAHHALPAPGDPFLRLEHRLMTLRYVRQHDHAMAWLARGLTAPQVIAMSGLWKGETGVEGHGLGELIESDHAADDPPRLTATGLDVRRAIEEETNTRAQRTFDVLDDKLAQELLAALRQLPGDID